MKKIFFTLSVLLILFVQACTISTTKIEEINYYSVIYNSNNSNNSTAGTVPVDSNKYEEGKTVTILENTGILVRSGYTFKGWNTSADGSGTVYITGVTFTMGKSDVTLYAEWSLNPTYSVTYNGNINTGGTVPVDSNKYEEGKTVTILENTGILVRSGYTFKGWNTSADGSGTVYITGVTFTMGKSDVTLYAEWSLNPTYSVTYNGNINTGGTVPVDSNKYEEGKTVTILENTGILVRSGYTFKGWNTSADGSGTVYITGVTFTMGKSDVTLYAEWSLNPTYSVTYNGNINTGGTVPVDSNKYEEGKTVTILENTGILVRSGYTFKGWNTSADGSGTVYITGVTFTMGKSDVTLYAEWSKVYTVTYNGNGHSSGSVPTDSKQYKEDAFITVCGNSGNLTKTGLNFSGWNTASDGSGTVYEDKDTLVMGAFDIILYAQWNKFNFQLKKLFSDDGANDDDFGIAVDIDGDYAVVGASKHDPDSQRSGAVYIFHKTGDNTWDSGFKITAPYSTDDIEFGTSVAISGDYVIVGAPKNNINGVDAGMTYIYHRIDTNTWGEVESLQGSDINIFSGATYFGISVDIDGDYAIIGAIGNKNESDVIIGAAYIYQRTVNNTWGNQEKIIPSDGIDKNYFGRSVAISGDYAVIGAHKDDDNGVNSGAAYVYFRSINNTWGAEAKLTASDAFIDDNFGYSVSIDGDYIVVGAYKADNTTNEDNSGAAYIFHRTSSNIWDTGTIISSTDNFDNNYFGISTSIKNDYVICGSPNNWGRGAAYIFKRTHTNLWEFEKKIISDDLSINDYFGLAVGLSAEFSIIGATGNQNTNGKDAGSIYIFK